ncbi:MAG TPA: hypothetical protein VNH44_09245 [Micropepsaceae bacterium]|nr:hypothetical protein [Micropepsaceae bacterium]
MVRDALLSDDTITKKFHLDTDAVLNFGDTGVGIQQAKLLRAISAAERKPGKKVRLEDRSGANWDVVVSFDRKRPGISMTSGKRVMQIGHLLLLTNDKPSRKKVFDGETERLNVPSKVIAKWRKIVTARPLTNDEVSDLMRNFTSTPSAVIEAISDHLARTNVSLNVLVPRSLEYYEQLVGRVDAQANVQEYVEQVAEEHIRKLLEWRAIDGAKQSLLLGSHSLVSRAIAATNISGADLNALLRWGLGADALSRATLIEVALGKPEEKAEIEAALNDLLVKFGGGGEKENFNQFSILSAAFIMVYGELGQTRVFASKPPYWLRLAAFAQAALITRCILAVGGRLTKFVDWMQSVRLADFLLLTYVDLRKEPRWVADWALPDQLRNELAGRVLTAAARNEAAAKLLGVHEALLGDAKMSLKARVDIIRTQLPGPLEGNVSSVMEIPPETLEQIRKALKSPSPDVNSFAMILNASHLFKVPPDIPDLAADAIRRAQYQLDNAGEPRNFAICLIGLASLAAISRNHGLANELFIVIRHYRRVFKDELPFDTAFRAGMIACASREDLMEWCKCVGALVSDLGFGELSREDASCLRPIITKLCELVPELWSTCGQGLAAIEAVALS